MVVWHVVEAVEAQNLHVFAVHLAQRVQAQALVVEFVPVLQAELYGAVADDDVA